MCEDNDRADSKTFYRTLCLFYSDKLNKSSGNIRLLKTVYYTKHIL